MKNAITTENFHLNTVANFTSIASAPDRTPDFRSDSGSAYWYENGQVIRESNHWGFRIASCAWLLDGHGHDSLAVGACDLADFICANGKIETAPIHLWAAYEQEGATLVYQVSDDMRLYASSWN